MKYMPFVYTVDEYTYRLMPVFHLNTTKRIRLVGVEMWGTAKIHYYGYWERHNMPMSLVYQLEQRCRALYRDGQYTTNDNGYFRERAEEVERPKTR